MKIIINVAYGSITNETAAHRQDPQLIEDVESGRFVGRVVEGSFGGYAECLRVVNIPDDATDYKIVNYDGCEGIIYVQNGNLYFEGCDECKAIFEQ